MGGVVPQKNTLFVTVLPSVDMKAKAAFLQIVESMTHMLLVFVEGGPACGLQSGNNIIFKDINSVLKFDKLDFLAAARERYYCDFCYFAWINYDYHDFPRQINRQLLGNKIIISAGAPIDDRSFIVPSDILTSFSRRGLMITQIFDLHPELFHVVKTSSLYAGYLKSDIEVDL